jgi:zinc protease
MKKVCLFVLIFCLMACMGMQVQSSETDLKQDVTVKLQVPDSGWRIRILEIHKVNKELWVISEVYRMKGMAAQVISTVEDTVTVPVSDLPVTHFVIGKTWNWSDGSPYTFIGSKDEIMKNLNAGECLYKRDVK